MRPTRNIVRTLSKRGACSRKEAVRLVQGGRVRVNGQKIVDPGTKIKEGDRISLDGKNVPGREKIYILLHKPPGIITTRKDEKGRKTVYSFVPHEWGWIFPVGRLDRDSEGLLLMTNDTRWGERLTNPLFKVPRTYKVLIDGPLSQKDLETVRRGMDIGRGEWTSPTSIRILTQDSRSTLVQITLSEGKNREIRRIFEHLGKSITRLIRTQFGPFHLGSLEPGRWRPVRLKSDSFSDPRADTGSQNPAPRTPSQPR